ncbi:hypothetical protein NCCP2495_27910 [Dietzia sp. NCCP-2495]|uniref:hypothetical protein n=1 Tax=Dietzia sp. NCCP-2495 TaxID=2934675 RepID=UPI0022307D25|nr:hypothetical protein [Dietzia sp. NCCP-2495]GLB64911.1 hypothetical protein NCCP2495_27910 [Dietzia sp. NCCP-2495]
MSATADLHQELDAARDRFEQYRVSVSAAFDDRPAGELSQAVEAVLPDLAFHEGQAVAAAVALDRLAAGADLAAVIRALDLLLLEQQAARRSLDFMSGVARVLVNVRRREAG